LGGSIATALSQSSNGERGWFVAHVFLLSRNQFVLFKGAVGDGVFRALAHRADVVNVGTVFLVLPPTGVTFGEGQSIVGIVAFSTAALGHIPNDCNSHWLITIDATYFLA
jgi:hypothetical protein